jgi:hypothetical protein
LALRSPRGLAGVLPVQLTPGASALEVAAPTSSPSSQTTAAAGVMLVRNGVADASFKPSLSPDGRSIAYECINSGGGGFCILRGRTVRRYPHGGFGAIWSPTGRWVATSIAGNLNSGSTSSTSRQARIA